MDRFPEKVEIVEFPSTDCEFHTLVEQRVVEILWVSTPTHPRIDYFRGDQGRAFQFELM
jgi:hypothetical protein